MIVPSLRSGCAQFPLVSLLVVACSSSATGTGGADSGTTPPPGPGGSSAEQTCVDTINQYRASLGLPAYTRWSSEETCADDQAKSDSMTGSAHGAFTQCGEFAQNECPGWPGPPAQMITQCLAAMWMEGPGGGHYENMRSSMYTQVACGFYTLPDGSVWAVQDFK
jgi:uncharacterized protein YkwD